MLSQIYAGEKIVTPRVRIYEPFELMKRLYKADYELIDMSFPIKEGDDLFCIRARSWSASVEQGFKTSQTLYKHNYLFFTEIDDSPEIWPGYEEVKYIDFRGAHAVTCSTDVLADRIREYNPYVKVLRNQIASLAPEKNFEDKGYITIFFGALNRKDCWQDIMPVLNKLIKKYKNKLQFRVLSDINFFESLETPNKRYTMDKKMDTKEFVSYNIYMNELYNSDIALLPLKDTSFNRAKSDLKFIESGNAQVAAIASPVVYENTIEDGKTGFIYRTPREFQAKLEILIKDRQKRIEMAKAAYEYVKRERLLINNIEERYNWMREMYAKREELNEAVLKRCEGIL